MGLPLLAVLILAVVGPTAGRLYIDLVSGVPPKQFIRSEWLVVTALLTGVVWMAAYVAGLGTWPGAGIAVTVGFVFHHLALYRGWEEPLADEPTGVYQHDDGRPLLGRKLRGKSHRELRELGLVVEGRERGSAEPSGRGSH